MAITLPALRLNDWQFKTPACDRFVRPKVDTDLELRIERFSSERTARAPLVLPLPLFWFDPPWHLASVPRCRDVSRAIAESGVAVTALHRELSQQDDCDASEFSPRIAPHRCDRAGWIHRDFNHAAIIDLRLTPSRDRSGRFAYESSQLRRWKNIDGEASDGQNRTVNALLFPPDWQSLDDMTTKVSQLRCLTEAAIFVSLDAPNLSALLPAIKHARVDGVILRVSGDPLATIVAARKSLDATEAERSLPLWVVPERALTAADYVKCVAFGANAVAVDSWCNDFLLNADASRSFADRAAYGLGFGSTSDGLDRIRQGAADLVNSWAEPIRGFANSCGVERLSELTPAHLEPVSIA